MTGTPFVKLTPLRESILRLVQSEGAVAASDVRDLILGRNLRTAASQLKALAGLGMLKPVRVCEFILSDLGQQWLDNHPRPL